MMLGKEIVDVKDIDVSIILQTTLGPQRSRHRKGLAERCIMRQMVITKSPSEEIRLQCNINRKERLIGKEAWSHMACLSYNGHKTCRSHILRNYAAVGGNKDAANVRASSRYLL